MSGAFPDSWYVTPVRFVRVSGGFGDNDRWEAAGDLPKALFAPSTASEDVKLSEAVERVARLYWERQAVHLESTDQVEVPALFAGGPATRWSLVGPSQVWPLGTVAVLEGA